MGRIEQDFKNLLTNHVHVPSRTIYITENITPAVSDRVIKMLKVLDAPRATITVFLNTYGGEVYEALAIYDAMKSCKAKIVTIGTGKVMSAGTVVLQGGKQRLLTPNTVVMCHHMSYRPSYQTAYQQKDEAEEGIRLQEQAIKPVSDAMGRTPKQFLAWCQRERNFDAQTAVELGLADGIYGG